MEGGGKKGALRNPQPHRKGLGEKQPPNPARLIPSPSTELGFPTAEPIVSQQPCIQRNCGHQESVPKTLPVLHSQKVSTGDMGMPTVRALCPLSAFPSPPHSPTAPSSVPPPASSHTAIRAWFPWGSSPIHGPVSTTRGAAGVTGATGSTGALGDLGDFW